MIFAAIIALTISSAVAYTNEALADKITSLPGAENIEINFNQFSGYLSVPGANGNSKNLHYWLVESMNDPSKDPVSFWTNGGPGCSGLIGFMTEQGPFKPTVDGTLTLNKYAWNQRSNMVFIEAPCGVGFSYSEEDADYHTDDATTATDNFELIQAFFNKFPDMLPNDLYITSESYGGHYMPTLAHKIVDENDAGVRTRLNFKGFAVGNPQTTAYSAIPAGLAAYWGHQLISKPTWDTYTSNCLSGLSNFNFSVCEMLLLDMYVQIGDLNPYALDYPVCLGDSRIPKAGRHQRSTMIRHQLKSMGVKDEKVFQAVGLSASDEYDPCVDDYAVAYLNRPEVQAALHVKANTWAECAAASSLHYSQTDSMHSMVPHYQYLIDNKKGLNILVYSGDDDSVCSTEGTQHWIWDMGYEVKGRKWQQYQVNNQTAGYITKWKDTKLAFATVHGAGHEVPTYKPEIALYLYHAYLDGTLTNA